MCCIVEKFAEPIRSSPEDIRGPAPGVPPTEQGERTLRSISMNEWKMKVIAHCGLDCAKCEGYIVTQADDGQALARVAGNRSAPSDAEIGSGEAICDTARTWKD